MNARQVDEISDGTANTVNHILITQPDIQSSRQQQFTIPQTPSLSIKQEDCIS